MSNEIDREGLRRMVAAGAQLIEVLPAEEYTEDHLPGAISIPLRHIDVYTTPFWIKARLEEVVVDRLVRGKGVGEALVKAALNVGRERGAQVAELNSARIEARAPAHRPYERLGFKIRDTDVMRIVL